MSIHSEIIDAETSMAFRSCNTVALRSTNLEIAPKYEQNIYWYFEGVEIDVQWSMNRSAPNAESVYIQQTLMPTVEKAKEYLRHIVSNSRCIRKLNLNIQVSTTNVIDVLLSEFIDRDNVRLEELHIRRRYVGQQFTSISKLILNNNKTLKIVGKIGLGEAINSFTGQVHLQRLSIFNFDLVEKDGDLASDELILKTRFFIRRMAWLGKQGLTFDHLSYTAYTGFEITKMPALHLLRQCQVRSLRLTMQTGVAISDPLIIGPLYAGLRRLELVGGFEVNSNSISKLFPSLEHCLFQEQDLVTGLIQRARVLSQVVPDYLREVVTGPVAAAC